MFKKLNLVGLSALAAALLVGSPATPGSLDNGRSTLLAQAPGPGMMRRGPDGKLELVPQPAAPRNTNNEIRLPEPLAIELPPGAKQLAPNAAPLRDLLAAATAGSLALAHDVSQPLEAGLHRVTWTAWDGTPGAGTPRLSKTATLFVLPNGLAPVGLSGSDHAVAGNTSAKIVRDAAGRVHMAWLDAGRGGQPPAVLYRRASTDASGGVIWETAPLRLNDARSEAQNAFVAVAASAGAVHVAWQANGSIRYRRLRRSGDGWTMDPIRDTSVRSEGHDVGPAIDAASDDEIHVVSPQGGYGVSKDGGARWLRGAMPIIPGIASKAASVALDRHGNAHVAYTGIVRGPITPSESRASDGYWELRYLRRSPDGAWTDAQNVLAGVKGWEAPADGSDVLADWIRIAVDPSGNLHAAWHGTANTRIYGNDEPFYIRREAAGPGAWQPGWQAPLSIYKTDRAKGERFAYAPSLSFDGETAVGVTFYEVRDRGRTVGFDSLARVIRRGAIDGAPIPLTRLVATAVAAGRPEQALGTWFPATAPRIHRDPNGRAWLDVLHAFEPDGSAAAPILIAYQRIDLTDWLGRR